MRSPIHRLSARAVQSRPAPGYYADGGGLYLQVKRSKNSDQMNRSWLFRYSHSQRPTWIGLGSVHDLSLSDARQRAAEYRRLLALGKDPAAERSAERALSLVEKQRSITFDQCAQAYLTAHRGGWRNAKHAAQWESTLKLHAHPIIGKLPVNEVELRHVLLVLEPIWRSRTETASRLRGRMESILDWATVRNFRQGDNPARWRGHLDKLLPMPAKLKKVEHHTALPYAELPAFMASLAEQEGMGARALRFAILTAARSGEVRVPRGRKSTQRKGFGLFPLSV